MCSLQFDVFLNRFILLEVLKGLNFCLQMYALQTVIDELDADEDFDVFRTPNIEATIVLLATITAELEQR